MIYRLAKHHGVIFLRYAAVGVIGTIIDVGLFALLITFTPLGNSLIGRIAAATISFIAAVANNYIWNRRWTFRDHQADIRIQFVKFFIVSCGGWALNTFCLMTFSQLIPSVIAKICASGIVLFYNYLINRYWTFRSVVQLERTQEAW